MLGIPRDQKHFLFFCIHQLHKKAEKSLKSHYTTMKWLDVNYHRQGHRNRKEEEKAPSKDFGRGQLISKCLFGVFNFFQKTHKNKSTWGIIVYSKVKFIRLFFGRIVSLKKKHYDFFWPLQPSAATLYLFKWSWNAT